MMKNMTFNSKLHFEYFSKTCLKRSLKKTQTYVFKTNNRLIQVQSIAECSTCTKLPPVFKTFILPIFSGCLRQVSLYSKF